MRIELKLNSNIQDFKDLMMNELSDIAQIKVLTDNVIVVKINDVVIMANNESNNSIDLLFVNSDENKVFQVFYQVRSLLAIK